jgi:hypothetical protein
VNPPAPAGVLACTAPGCRRPDAVERGERNDGAVRLVCPTHRKYFLGTTS